MTFPRIIPSLLICLFTWPQITQARQTVQTDAPRHAVAEIIIMRHDVRPPIETGVSAPAITARQWPSWPTAPGQLTDHGAIAARALGTYTAMRWHDEGLPDADCAHTPAFRTDHDQRTIDTARAFAAGAIPACPRITIDTGPQGTGKEGHDRLFDPVSAGVVTFDQNDAEQAMRDSMVRWQSHAGRSAGFTSTQARLGNILNNQAWRDAAPLISVGRNGRPALHGALLFGFQLSDTFMMEYEQGLPVAWGMLDATGVGQVLALNAAYNDLTWRVPYIAQRQAAGMLDMIARKFSEISENTNRDHADSPIVIVGHDDNISAISGALGLDWADGPLPGNVAMPGGGLVFTLFENAPAKFSVDIRYIAPTLDEVRNLTYLDAAHPPAIIALRHYACPGAASEKCGIGAFLATIHAVTDPITPISQLK